MKKKIIAVFVLGMLVLIPVVFYFIKLQSKKQNIILITMDALRPDYMGCYGYKRNTTPMLEAFAKDAVMFTQAISQSSHTAPSNASLITSTYPCIHGVKDWGYELNPALPALPAILNSHGYHTAFISDALGFAWMGGFKKGFNEFMTLSARYISIKVENRRRMLNITDWAIDWLKENRKKRFFLWVYYVDPHGPYMPSSPYGKLFFNDEKDSPDRHIPVCAEQFEEIGNGCIPFNYNMRGKTSVNFYISQYCGEIRETDTSVGKLLAEIKNLGLYDKTIIIFNSDHGESMGDHNHYFSHASSLYDSLIRIPLIIRNPQIRQEIKEIKQQVRAIDIAPTILDFLGIKAPGSMQGMSLKDKISGRKDNDSGWAFSEWSDMISVRGQRHKLIYHRNNNYYELYDLKDDPKELRNLYNNQDEKLLRPLKEKITEYLQMPSFNGEKREMDEEEKQHLKYLGYM